LFLDTTLGVLVVSCLQQDRAARARLEVTFEKKRALAGQPGCCGCCLCCRVCFLTHTVRCVCMHALRAGCPMRGMGEQLNSGTRKRRESRE